MNPEKLNRFNRFAPPLLVYAVIFFFSSRPAGDLPDILPDIVPHFIEYFLLGFFLLRAFGNIPEGKSIWKYVLTGCGLLILLAFLDELHQYFVPTRFFQLKDLLVDFLGGLSGMTLQMMSRKKQQG